MVAASGLRRSFDIGSRLRTRWPRPAASTAPTSPIRIRLLTDSHPTASEDVKTVPARSDHVVPGTPVDLDEAEQLRLLVREYSAAIYRVALSIVRDSALAEDVTQDTLMKAWQALPGFRGESSLRSWVLRIAHNTAISTLRKRRDVLADPNTLPERETRGSVERDAQDRAVMAEFTQALEELDELSRSIVVLRELEHQSYEEIATTLDLPLPTVKTRLFRARRKLAHALEGWK